MTGRPSDLPAGTVTDAAALALPPTPVPPDQIVAGTPATGVVELGAVTPETAVQVGVWEMTPGAMRDVEADEVFVVIAGRATVAFEEPPLPGIELRPGSIVRLTAGMRTVWTVHETLRKVYLAP